MNAQASLFEDRPAPSVGTLNSTVLGILSRSSMRGEWLMPWEICDIILKYNKVRISDSSCTARIRDLKKSKYGGHTITKRIREGSRAYEYRIGTGLF